MKNPTADNLLKNNQNGRTGKRPSVDQPFLERICHALDEPPRVLARNAGIEYKELAAIMTPRYLVAEIDRSDTWQAIAEYADKRLADMLAVRQELNKLTQSHKTQRAMRLTKQLTRTKKSVGRS